MADLRIVERVLEEFAAVNPDMTLPAIRTMIHVINNPGLTQRDLESYMELSNAGSSRNVSFWAEIRGTADRRPGLHYMTRTEDPSDRRYRLLHLTAKGKQFADRLKGVR